MNRYPRQPTRLSAFALFVLLSACAGAASLGEGGTHWKEEVRLHDGRTLVVERAQRYGGRREPGQGAPVAEHTITFTLPGAGRPLAWTSEYGEELGRANFNVLALHVREATPYLVVEPNLCLAYNKWGRPNPPYLVFRHDGAAWQRIALAELPAEFKDVNLIINTKRVEEIEELAAKPGYVPAEGVRRMNGSLKQPEYQGIIREPIGKRAPSSAVNCEEMIHYKCGWISPHGTFGRNFMDSTCK